MSFVADLKFDDLRRLREVVKKLMRHHNWPEWSINDYEADKWIEAQGPEVAANMVKQAIDRQLVD